VTGAGARQEVSDRTLIALGHTATARVGLCLLALAVATCGPATAQTVAPDEKGILTLWTRHVDATEDHAGIGTAARKFSEAAPRDALATVARGIEAWHLLKAGEQEQATKVYTYMLRAAPPPGTAATTTAPLYTAAADMARTWLTRMDRDQVKLALRAYYRKHVEYPETLAAVATLREKPVFPKTDRWGTTWSYRLAPLRIIKDVSGQRYELNSTNLRAWPELADALKLPYAAGIAIEPVKIVTAAPGRQTVQFARAGSDEGAAAQDAYLTLGADSDGVFFAYLGQHLIILSDGNHWKILPKPRP